MRLLILWRVFIPEPSKNFLNYWIIWKNCCLLIRRNADTREPGFCSIKWPGVFPPAPHRWMRMLTITHCLTLFTNLQEIVCWVFFLFQVPTQDFLNNFSFMKPWEIQLIKLILFINSTGCSCWLLRYRVSLHATLSTNVMGLPTGIWLRGHFPREGFWLYMKSPGWRNLKLFWGVQLTFILLSWGWGIFIPLASYVVPRWGEKKCQNPYPMPDTPPPPSRLSIFRCIIWKQSVGSLLMQWCLSSAPHSYKSTTFQVNSLPQEISCHHLLKNWKSVLLPIKRNTNVGNAGT